MSQALRLVPPPINSSEGRSWRDRWLDRWYELQCWLLSNSDDRSPLVVVRRTTVEAREINAFQIGMDAGRAGYRR